MLGEGLDLRQFFLRVVGAEGEEAGGVDDVLPAGQLRAEAGAELQQAEHPPADVERASVGYMAVRILSRVLLPDPLTPMTPSGLVAGDVEGDVAKRPEVLVGSAWPRVTHSASRPHGRGRS